MRSFTLSAIAATVLLFAQEVYAQSATNMNALMGLAPVSALQNTIVGTTYPACAEFLTLSECQR